MCQMRIVVQRVTSAAVTVAGAVVGSIDNGLVVLGGVAAGDDVEAAKTLARRVAGLRIFANADGRCDRSLVEVGGSVLAVSQFTLITDARRPKGARPDFSGAARPDVAEPLYHVFCDALRAHGVPVESGVFGASMQVALVNDGPVTVILEADGAGE